MITPLSNLTFPWMKRFADTAKEAREAGLAMVVAGAPKSGKTTLLEIERRSVYRDTEQEVLMFRMQRESDVLGQVQVLSERLAENTLPKNWKLHRLGYMASFLARRLKQANQGLLILTNCQEAGSDFFNVIFDVVAEARSRGHTCGLILAGTGDSALMEDLTCDRVACVRQYVQVPELGHGDIAACLKAWCQELGAELARQTAAADSDAVAMLGEIAHSTAGNILRVKLFAEIKNRKFGGKEFTSRLVKDVFAEMRVGGSMLAKK